MAPREHRQGAAGAARRRRRADGARHGPAGTTDGRSSRAGTRGRRRRSRWASSRSTSPCPGVPFDVVRRPSGGRAVLHGEGFEWSFAVAFPPGALGAGPGAGVDVTTPYDLVAGAFAGAFDGARRHAGRGPRRRRTSARRCASRARCATTCSRAARSWWPSRRRAEGRVLVHGSVLERRPPDELVQVAETLLGEPWQGDGLAGAGSRAGPGDDLEPRARAARGLRCERSRPTEEERHDEDPGTRRRPRRLRGRRPRRAARRRGDARRGARDRRHLPEPRLHPDQGDGRRRRAPARRRATAPTSACVAGAVGLDFAAFMARKDAVTTQLRDGVAHLLKARKVEVVAGRAALAGPGRLTLTADGALADGSTLAAGRCSRATPSSSPAARSRCAWASSTGATRACMTSDELLRDRPRAREPAHRRRRRDRLRVRLASSPASARR